MPLYVCSKCGKDWVEGCDSICGRRMVVCYTLCEKCEKELKKDIAKILKEVNCNATTE